MMMDVGSFGQGELDGRGSWTCLGGREGFIPKVAMCEVVKSSSVQLRKMEVLPEPVLVWWGMVGKERRRNEGDGSEYEVVLQK